MWFALVGVRMDHSLGRGVRDMSFFPWPRAVLLPGLRLVSVQRCYWTVYRLLAGGILEPRACFQFNFRGLLQWTGRDEGQKTQLHRHMVSDLSDLGYLFSLKRVRDKRATGGSDQRFLLSTVLGKSFFLGNVCERLSKNDCMMLAFEGHLSICVPFLNARH